MAEKELSPFENTIQSEANRGSSQTGRSKKKKKERKVHLRFEQVQKKTERTYCVCRQGVTLNQGHKRRATSQCWEWVKHTRPHQLIDVLNNQYLIVKGSNRFSRRKRMGNADFRRSSNVAVEPRYTYKKMQGLKCRKNIYFQPDSHEKDRTTLISLGERRGELLPYPNTGVNRRVVDMGQSGYRSLCTRETQPARGGRIYQLESKFIDYDEKRQMLTQQLVNADSRIRDWDLSNILPHSDCSSVASAQNWQSKFTSSINKKYYPEKVRLERSRPTSVQVMQRSNQDEIKNPLANSGFIFDSRRGSGNMPPMPNFDMSAERHEPRSECWDCWTPNINLFDSSGEDSSDTDISEEIHQLETNLGHILPNWDNEKAAVNFEHTSQSSQFLHRNNLTRSGLCESTKNSTNSTQNDTTKNPADNYLPERSEHLSHNSLYEAGTSIARYSQQVGSGNLGQICLQKSSEDSLRSHQHGDAEHSKSQRQPQKHCSYFHLHSSNDSEKSRASPYVEISEDGLFFRDDELPPQESPFEHLSESLFENQSHCDELPSSTLPCEQILRPNSKQKRCRANDVRPSKSSSSIDEKISSQCLHARDKSCLFSVQRRNPDFYTERNKEVPTSTTGEKRETFCYTDEEICRIISSFDKSGRILVDRKENGRLLAKEESERIFVGREESDTLLTRGGNGRLLTEEENETSLARKESGRLLEDNEQNRRLRVSNKVEGRLTDEENKILSAKEEDETLSIRSKDNETEVVGREENEYLEVDREENERFSVSREKSGGCLLNSGNGERLSAGREASHGLLVREENEELVLDRKEKGSLIKVIEECTQLLLNGDENRLLLGVTDEDEKVGESKNNKRSSEDCEDTGEFLVQRKENERIFPRRAENGRSSGDNEENDRLLLRKGENGSVLADSQILVGDKENRLPFKSDVDERVLLPGEGQELFSFMNNQKGILNSENNMQLLLGNKGNEKLLCNDWDKIQGRRNEQEEARPSRKDTYVVENDAILLGNEIDKCSLYKEDIENFLDQCLILKESQCDEPNEKPLEHNKKNRECCLSNFNDEKLSDETAEFCQSLPEDVLEELLLLIKNWETQPSCTSQSCGHPCHAKREEFGMQGNDFPLQIEERCSRYEDTHEKTQTQWTDDSWTTEKSNEKQMGQMKDGSPADKDGCKENEIGKESVKHGKYHLVQNDNNMEMVPWSVSYEEFGNLEDQIKLIIESWENNEFDKKYDSLAKEIPQETLSLSVPKTGNSGAECETKNSIETGKRTNSTSFCFKSASETIVDTISKRRCLENFENSIGGCNWTHTKSNLAAASGNLNTFDNKRETLFSVPHLQQLSPVSQSSSRFSSNKTVTRGVKKKKLTRTQTIHKSQKQLGQAAISRKRSHNHKNRQRKKSTKSLNTSTRHQSPSSTDKANLTKRKILSRLPLKFSKSPVWSKGKRKILRKFKKTKPIARNAQPQILDHHKTMSSEYQTSCSNSKRRCLYGRWAKKGSTDIDNEFGGTVSRRNELRKKSISDLDMSRARPSRKKGKADSNKEFGGTSSRRKKSRSGQRESCARSESAKNKLKSKRSSSKLGKKEEVNLDFSKVRRTTKKARPQNKRALNPLGHFEDSTPWTPEVERSSLCFYKFNHLKAKSFETLGERVFERDQERLNRFACHNINTNTKSTMARDNWFRANNSTPPLQMTWIKRKAHSDLAMKSLKTTAGIKSKKVNPTHEGQGESVGGLRQSGASKKFTHKQHRNKRKAGKNTSKNMDATNLANLSGTGHFGLRTSHGTKGRQSVDKRLKKLPESPKVRKRLKDKKSPMKNIRTSVDATTQTFSPVPEVSANALTSRSSIVEDELVNLKQVITTPSEETKLDQYEIANEPNKLNAESLTLFLMMSFPKLRF